MRNDTIYDRLLELGYTDEEIREAAKARPSSRQFGLAVADTPDGTPIVGIQYVCDFRAEEEWGIGKLQDALGVPKGPEGWTMGGSKYANHFTIFTDVPEAGFAFAISEGVTVPETAWGDHIADPRSPHWPHASAGKQTLAERPDLKDWQVSDKYDIWWESSVAWAQEMSSARSIYKWTTVKELKEVGAKLGIEKFKRSKADILEQIKAADKPLQPNIWPGWFHYGDVFVLRADRGIVADVLEMLYEASQRGQLSFGGGSQVFGAGLSLYDGRDVGIKLNRERKAYARWYKKAMKALAPVEKTLKAKGHKWYFLGKPRENEDGSIRYWLNGAGSGPGYTKQPYGWYTIKELLDEKFVEDVNKKEKV